jgi:hypothetical protein
MILEIKKFTIMLSWENMALSVLTERRLCMRNGIKPQGDPFWWLGRSVRRRRTLNLEKILRKGASQAL